MIKMEQEDRQFSVTWRGKIFILKMNPAENLKALGDELQALTNVKAETLRLIVPMKKSSKLIYPFSDEHSHVSLEAAPIHEGLSIRMMGVLENEVNEVIQNSKADLRIAGFDEEDKRMRMRVSNGKNSWPKLPQGTYLFSDFRTLHLPGIVLNPPPSEALKLMHRLAADPGIVAIMNKHRWRVGIMTEMAPVGYVGVSPMCILGYNKNHGEEISLRLRTDDLNGFRKYESIKKTLLHELAHMVHSEHDANFYALDKQLNEEAATLDWTKSKGHTLSAGVGHSHYFEDEDTDTMSSLHKLGGQTSVFSSARESSAAAAYRRLTDASTAAMRMPYIHEEEPDPDDSEYTTYEPNPVNTSVIDDDKDTISMPQNALNHEPEQNLGYKEIRGPFEQYQMQEDHIAMGENSVDNNDDQKNDLDESGLENGNLESNPMDENSMIISEGTSIVNTNEPDPDELQRIQDPVSAICSRLQKAKEMLTSELNISEASSVVQKIIKIIKNAIDHPEETKYRRLRKANPIIKRDITSHRGAMEILNVIGFSDETVYNEQGNAEAYLVLKRNDPGLLWLAKTSLQNSDS